MHKSSNLTCMYQCRRERAGTFIKCQANSLTTLTSLFRPVKPWPDNFITASADHVYVYYYVENATTTLKFLFIEYQD